MTGMEWVPVIVTAAIGVIGLFAGFFRWLAGKFDAIGDHLTQQDVDISAMKTDMAWVKAELEKKQDKREGK